MNNEKEQYYTEKAASILKKIRINGEEIDKKDTNELVNCIKANNWGIEKERNFLSDKSKLYILKTLLFHGFLLEPIFAAKEIRNMLKDKYTHVTENDVLNIYQGEKKYNTTDFCSGILLQEIMKQ